MDNWDLIVVGGGRCNVTHAWIAGQAIAQALANRAVRA
jgi:predicted flavoprotein YhiN